MTRLRDLLQNADPLRYESTEVERGRNRLRQAIITVASTGNTPQRVQRRMPLVVLGAVASVIVVLVIAGSQVWWRPGGTVQAAVRFEVRLAEDQPAAGLEAARVAKSSRVVYLHREVIVTNADIARSTVVPGATPSQFWIDVRLTAAGAQKMRQATTNHIGKPVAIIIDGDVVSAPTVKSPIGGSAVISGDYTRADADRIAQGMNPNH
jgi:hypothetical protein